MCRPRVSWTNTPFSSFDQIETIRVKLIGLESQCFTKTCGHGQEKIPGTIEQAILLAHRIYPHLVHKLSISNFSNTVKQPVVITGDFKWHN